MGLIESYNQSPEERYAMLKDKYGISPERDNEAKKNIAQRKAKEALNKKRYCQGVYLETIPTQYGDMIKVAVNKDMFCKENYITAGGYISFFIKRGPNGYYAENVNWDKK